jgi:hypothetical protein
MVPCIAKCYNVIVEASPHSNIYELDFWSFSGVFDTV